MKFEPMKPTLSPLNRTVRWDGLTPTKCPRFLLYSVYSLTLFLIYGCGESYQASSHQAIIPESISIDGETWTQKPWTDAEDKKLAAYFLRNPSLAENPGLSGTRVFYKGVGGTDRFYWVSTVGDQCQWILLEFKGARAGEPIEGTGPPFTLQTSMNEGG